jgi:hypothetical protein
MIDTMTLASSLALNSFKRLQDWIHSSSEQVRRGASSLKCFHWWAYQLREGRPQWVTANMSKLVIWIGNVFSGEGMWEGIRVRLPAKEDGLLTLPPTLKHSIWRWIAKARKRSMNIFGPTWIWLLVQSTIDKLEFMSTTGVCGLRNPSLIQPRMEQNLILKLLFLILLLAIQIFRILHKIAHR